MRDILNQTQLFACNDLGRPVQTICPRVKDRVLPRYKTRQQKVPTILLQTLFVHIT